jgi:hypothetical protein
LAAFKLPKELRPPHVRDRPSISACTVGASPLRRRREEHVSKFRSNLFQEQ